ncbi:heme-binding protein 1-like [Heterodontus francisci]|uniref:heme-binding protein 1-like n=1 Tax=Heterodontus francisci TaxID=7792 RepID=UPI00355BFD33
MFGMITNSLFSQPENRPCQTLKSGTKGDLTYEERKYEAGNYASVTISGKPFNEGSGEGALKLLKYVGGSNEQAVQMGMTAPVSMTVQPGEAKSLQPKVEVQIRIPSKFQENIPKPTDESIEIKHHDGFTVYSSQFGGYAKEVHWVEQAEKLQAALGDNVSYHQDFYVCAGYDPPMKPIGRKNEVWFVKKEG